MTIPRRALLAGAAAVAAFGGPAAAQTAWPSRPIRLVVPYAPGGGTDVVARLVGAALQERLGQPVVIENRGGAGATIGSQLVAEAKPDGYTLLMSSIASHAVSPALYGNVRYDPLRDFAHIGLVSTSPSVWVANPRVEVRTLQDVVRLAGTQAGGFDIASSGAGSSNHLLIVRFGQLTGAKLNHVSFRGAGPAMMAVIGNQVPMMSDTLPSATGHIRQGSVRAIAVSSAERDPTFPDLPTFREQGFDLVSGTWLGLSAPAGTPDDIVQRLARELRAVLSQPDVRARYADFGGTPGDLSPAAFTAFVQREVQQWAPVVKASGARAD